MKPRLLDGFGGAGGAAKGYQRAGFYVVGVDIKPQPRYAGDEFIQGDAVEYIRDHGNQYDAIHTSPPCQALTTASNRWRGKGTKADTHPNLIPATRAALIATGKPYVIENVPGARRWMQRPITIRGGTFGLTVDRPRLFEVSFPILELDPPAYRLSPIGVYGNLDGRRLTQNPRSDGSHQYAPKTIEEARLAMGIDWMEWDELRESIPPAFTEYVGRYLMRHLLGIPALPQLDMFAA